VAVARGRPSRQHLVGPAALAARRIEDDPPQPRLERSLAAEVGAAPDGQREALLNRLVAELAVAADGCGHPAELCEPRPVDAFDRFEAGALVRGHLHIRRAARMDSLAGPNGVTTAL
jgi:hypothetical protein